MTVQTRVVLHALLEREPPADALYGLEIVRASGLLPGTVYPILQRLRDAGWLTAHWERNEDAEAQGRPARKYYSLTTIGRARAVHALAGTVRDHTGLAWLLDGEGAPG